MGQESTCVALINRKRVTGKVRLEMETLEFRGQEIKLTVSFKQLKKVGAKNGVLSMTSPDGTLSFHVGAVAAKWADKIQHPPSRLAKLGVKPGLRVSALGMDDADGHFLRELENAGVTVSIGRVTKATDIIFYGVSDASQLSRLARLKSSIQPAGAIWVVRPKGRPEISEAAVMAAGKAAGLVDVKVVSFSPTHTAEKFVIPVAAR